MKKLNLFAATLLSAALFASCADMFQDRVPMIAATNGATLAKIFEKTVEIEKLAAPSQVFVTNGEYNNKIIITWEKVKGARSYRLERAVSTEKDANGNWVVPDEGAFEALPHSTFIEGASFTDTIIDNTPANLLDYTNEAYSCGYFYRVLAENKIQKYEESEWFPDYYKTDADGNPVPEAQRDPYASGMLLTPPSNVKATCGKYTNAIDITWDKAVGAISSYRIYRSLNEDGSSGTQIGSVYGNKSNFKLEVEPANQGVEYYFTVVSVGASGNESVASPVALGYALKPGAPSQIIGVTIDKGRGDITAADGVTISWQAAVGGTGTIYYRVYRYSSVDSTQRKIAEKLTALTAPDTSNLKPNVFYYYQVQAYCTNDTTKEELKGAMSDSGDESENPAEAYILSPPQSVSVKKIQGDISQNVIVFSAAIGSQDCIYNSEVTIKKADWNSYTYCVYGGETASGSFTLVKEFPSPTKSQEEGMYEEKVQARKFYKVSVKNGTVESDQSAAIAPAPYAAQKLVVTKNAALATTGNDGNANANGVHAIMLFWKAPEGGADGGYHIYRSTKPNSGFKKITESPVTETSFTYKDEQAKAGNYYYYKVLSLNSLGQGANYTEADYGYGALTTYQYVREYIKTTLNSQKKLTLMHKSGNTAKLGQETASGTISGTLSYDAHVSGVSGRVIMTYTNYADYYIMSDKKLGVYFLLNGNTNTSAGMDTNGTMDGTVQVQGMYPGSVSYNAIQIKGGAAGGGTYGVTRNLSAYTYKDDGTYETKTESLSVNADWTWGEK